MKKNLLFTFALLLFFVASAFAQNAELNVDAAKLYNEGNSLKKAGNYSGSIESYTKALDIQKDYRIYYQLSSVYKKQRDFSKAEEALEKALELKPDFYIAYNSLGTTYYSSGDYDKAIESFKKYRDNVDDEKNKARAGKYMSFAYTKLGESALVEKNYVKAEEYLKSAVESSDYDAAYVKLADVYVETGKYDEALSAAENALKYRGKKSKVPKGAPYFYKGMAYKGLNDNTQAKENFKIASSDKTYRDRSNHEIKYLN